MTLGPPRRPKLALALPALASALLSLSQAAGAQAGDPPKTDGSLERAQKAADSVFHWIKLNADKGASRQTPAPAPAPAPAPIARKPVAAAPRPAPAPTAPQTAAAPSPAPEPVVAQAPAPVASEPEEAPQVLLASAQPTPDPAAPLAAATRAVEPPPPPVEEEEVPLKLLSKVNPEIPRQMRGQSFHNGFAQVQFTVQPDGRVGQVQVIKASHTRLGTAAVEAVRQWRFAPIPKPREAGVEIAFSSDEG